MTPFSYVLPIVADVAIADAEFDAYLASIGAQADLVIVDGSSSTVFAHHHARWSQHGRHIPPEILTLNGKVGSVVTGVRHCRHERVVIADNDVRFGAEVHNLIQRLDHADIVRPQNYFSPLPWHAAWDSGRSLLNRALGGDWPGTVALRRSALLAAGGYAGTVMFENYELCKTIEAVGGRHEVADDVFVRRLPPTVHHFLRQRVRQAYDEFARPTRLACFLAVVPAGATITRRCGLVALWRTVVASVLAISMTAELGRRHHGAATYFPLQCSLLAPFWVAERSVCVWAALVARAEA